jgi:hypothetical protein
MRKNIILLLCILLLSGCTKGVIKEEAHSNVTEEIQKYSLEETMETLVSEEFKGRLPGTEGNERATSYIENRFKEMDLVPYKDNTYLQGYTQRVCHPDEQKHSLIIEYKDGTKEELKLGVDYMYNNFIYNEDISLEITSNVEDKDISKKMLLLDSTDELGAYLSKAGGLLIKREGFHLSAIISQSNVPIIHVNPQVYERIVSNNGKIVNIKSEHKIKEMEVYNVAGKIPGKDNKKALILSSHFDHVGWRGDAIFYGAIDNASGTTVLLDVANKLKEYSDINPFKMDIIIVAFNGEEGGLLGSGNFVDDIKNVYEDIYNINIDCVGSKSGGKIAFDPDNYLARDLIEELKIRLERNNVEYEDKYYGMSDHQSFLNQDIPAVSVGQGDLNFIHTQRDNIEDVDFQYLQRISNSIYNFVLGNNGKTFNSSEDTIDHASPSPEIWEEAYKKSEEIKKEMNIQYDEEFQFKIEGYTFIGSGNKKIYKIDEVKDYYPNIRIVENLSKYKFNNVIVDGWSYGISQITGGMSFDGEISKVTKRNIDINNVHGIIMEYTYGEKVLEVEVGKNEIRPGFYEGEIRLDGDRKDYIIRRDEISGIYSGFYTEPQVGLDTFYINFILYTPGELASQGTKSYDFYKNLNTEEELIELIDEIIAEINMEEMVRNLFID